MSKFANVFAVSGKNGITFYSNGKQVIATRKGCEVIRKKYNNNIIRRFIMYVVKARCVTFNYMLISLIIWYIQCPVKFIALVGDIFLFLLLIVYIKEYNDVDKVQKSFHAAEHKVLNAYAKLKHVPTLEEAKQYSMLSNRCGANIYILDALWIFLTKDLFQEFSNPIFLAITIVCVGCIIELLRFTGVWNVIQFPFLEETDDRKLEIAINGLNEVLKP